MVKKSSYQISNFGRIKNKKTTKILIANLDKRGYPRIRLCFKSDRSSFRIHRLVAIAFIPNPENKLQVNHIDGNKKNNNYLNLEWNTNSENQLHANKIGLRVYKKGSEANKFKSSVLVFDLLGNQIDELFF